MGLTYFTDLTFVWVRVEDVGIFDHLVVGLFHANLGCARPLNFSLAEICTENTFPYTIIGGSARKCT